MRDALIFYVYVLFKPWDGSPFYIGKGKGRRYRQHAKTPQTPYMRRIFEKAKRLSLEVPIVFIRENISESEAFQIERAFIAAIGRRDKGLGPLANLTDGGEGAANPSKSTIRKRVEKLRGKTHSPEARAKISATLTGHPVSAETRIKIGKKAQEMWGDLVTRIRMIEALRARKYSPSQEVREQARLFHTGRKRSPETIARMRKAAQNRKPRAPYKLSEETRAKMSLAAKNRPPHLRNALGNRTRGKPLSEEHKEKMRATKRLKRVQKAQLEQNQNIERARLSPAIPPNEHLT